MTTSAASSDSVFIACQQILQQDGSVFSIQWLDLPPALAAELSSDILLQKYLAHIRRITGTLVRPTQLDKTVEFRLWRSRVTLLRFHLGKTDAAALTLHITGGILVQPGCRRLGQLTLSCEPRNAGTRISLCLSGYYPRLLGGRNPGPMAKWCYRLTQATIHKLVTVRFLVRLHRERAEKKIPYRLIRVRIRDGEPL
ncbi:MAG: hypothetical protein P8X63_11560 [Desulfuromonadaceae bacterium]